MLRVELRLRSAKNGEKSRATFIIFEEFKEFDLITCFLLTWNFCNDSVLYP